MSRQLKVITVSAVIVSLLVITVAAVASGFIAPINPADGDIPEGAIIAASLTIPPSRAVTYVAYPMGEVVSPDGRSIAILDAKSAQLAGSVSAYFPALTNVPNAVSDPDSQITFTLLSSVKYSSQEHDTLVTVVQPSGSLDNVILGERQAQLASGKTAWLTEYDHDEYPNRAIRVDGDLLITVASSLPIEDVQNFAAATMVQQ